MKLLPYLATASAVLAGAIIVSISLREYRVPKVPRKYKRPRAGPVLVIESEYLEEMWRDSVLPNMERLAGCEVVPHDDFILGRCKFKQYSHAVRNCSAMVIVLDQTLLDDQDPKSKSWHMYALQLACNENVPVVLYHPENIQIPQALKTIIKLRGTIISFCPEHLKRNSYVMRLSEDLALGVIKAQTEEQNLPKFNSMALDTKFRHEVYLIHDPKDDWVPLKVLPYLEHQGFRNIIPSSGVPLGRYLCLCQVEAAQESQYIYIMLTPNLLKNPLFEFHLALAMAFKEADNIVFLIDKSIEGLLRQNRAFDYAFAVCKKVQICRIDA